MCLHLCNLVVKTTTSNSVIIDTNLVFKLPFAFVDVPFTLAVGCVSLDLKYHGRLTRGLFVLGPEQIIFRQVKCSSFEILGWIEFFVYEKLGSSGSEWDTLGSTLVKEIQIGLFSFGLFGF